ncbi:MAG: MBOAT family protein [Oscillospiraceae bacterium]|jgi:alginate O-acetyltransferase complex protein AlgI|nr:MBOAT family protein [Oscillospiraceae bacterium]
MLFNSLDFLIFFPIVTLLYFVIPRKVRYLFLLAASYYFYMCWNPRYALLMLLSTAITYFSGLLISRANRIPDPQARERRRRLWVWLSFGSNLAILCVFKYLTFFLENLTRALGLAGVAFQAPAIDLLLPVGISFYTFQALGYTMDVYRGDIDAEPNFFRYALFVSFFPQLVAGPIERSGSLLRQLREHQRFDGLQARAGLVRMGWGLFQKMVIADRLAILVGAVYNNPAGQPGSAVALATVIFCFQIYCDFGGYSNIAIGAAQVMGVRLMDNFRQPFLARSIQDFWRRWHISLSTWFRDYLYFPLGGSRKGTGRAIANNMAVFLVSGLWHGAGWHFILWGGLHGLYQGVGRLTLPARRRIRGALGISEENPVCRLAAWAFTFSLVAFAFLLFRANSMSDAALLIRALFLDFRPEALLGGGLYELGLDRQDFAAAAVSVLVLILSDLLQERRPMGPVLERQPLVLRWTVYLLLIFAVLIFGIYGPGYDAAAFIYFAF